MAKEMVGKKIQEIVNLGNGLTKILFTDGTYVIVCTMSNIIKDSSSKTSDDDDDEDEDDEEDEEEEEEDDDEEDDEEDEKDDLTGEDLVAMDFDELEDVVDDFELDVDVDDFEDDEDGLRKAIAKEMKLKLPASKKGGKKGKK